MPSPLGALTSLTGGGGLTGGSSGPAKTESHTSTKNNSGFTGGSVNMGSNNGVSMWIIALAIAATAYIVLKK